MFLEFREPLGVKLKLFFSTIVSFTGFHFDFVGLLQKCYRNFMVFACRTSFGFYPLNL